MLSYFLFRFITKKCSSTKKNLQIVLATACSGALALLCFSQLNSAMAFEVCGILEEIISSWFNFLSVLIPSVDSEIWTQLQPLKSEVFLKRPISSWFNSISRNCHSLALYFHISRVYCALQNNQLLFLYFFFPLFCREERERESL